MHIAPLQQTPLPQLHAAFLLAFADYLIPMQLNAGQFAALLLRRGWQPDLSIAAWHEGQLVGFWLSGIIKDATPATAYCISAGVLPAYRRQGLLRQLHAMLCERLQEQRIKRQQLEVICDNKRAIDAYHQLGFQQQRRLDCYALYQLCPPRTPWPVQQEEHPRPEQWPPTEWLGFPPSVQNQRNSLLRADPPPRLLTISQDACLLASLALFENGDVAELLVHPDYRRQGMASSLLYAAHRSHDGPLLLSNIDGHDQAMHSLLQHHHASYRLSQWEMLRNSDLA